jgi:phosphoribosylglycinamide formyltransferase-1
LIGARSRRLSVDVLISGRGTNMAALIAASRSLSFPAAVKRVISNRPDAGGLALAAAEGIQTLVIDHKNFPSREAHEEALHDAISSGLPDLICLAGYMRILSADFVHRHEGRILNIHPSLLPAFAGVNTHARALAAGVKLHGATVHYVTERVDDGPIVAQAAVPVLAEDTVDTLAARVLAAENRLYPHALALVATGIALSNMPSAKTPTLFWPPLHN